jgi:hypothetical protein
MDNPFPARETGFRPGGNAGTDPKRPEQAVGSFLSCRFCPEGVA